MNTNKQDKTGQNIFVGDTVLYKVPGTNAFDSGKIHRRIDNQDNIEFYIGNEVLFNIPSNQLTITGEHI